MGVMRDAFERAWAKSTSSTQGRTQPAGEREARPILHIKRRGTAVAKSDEASPLSVPTSAKPKQRATSRNTPTRPIRMNWAAIDARIRKSLAQSRPTHHAPDAAFLDQVYGSKSSKQRGRSIPDSAPTSAAVVAPTIKLGPKVRVVAPPTCSRTALLEQSIEDRGVALVDVVGTPAAPRELVLGLDFGSSSTKMVICDRAAGASLAVAVADVAGQRRYLLPSVVYERDGRYNLAGGGTLYAGLKSDLLASPGDTHHQERVIAYLALVIRRARGWLFNTQADVYRDVPLIWTLSIGIPKRQGATDGHFALYEMLAAAAWQVAGEIGPVTNAKVAAALARNQPQPCADETVEVRVIPEIAAEIYGFVSSESFDPRADNIFLMVDVGGTTLDASLFYVKKGKANRWSFSFFTSQVRPLGAIQLHRARIDWWTALLGAPSHDESAVRLINSLDELKHRSMFEEQIQDDIHDYVAGVTLSGIAVTPDDQFRSDVAGVVRRDVYGNAVNVQVPAHQMMGIPYFLCGGGSRMRLYSNVIQKAMMRRGDSRLYAVQRQLQTPANLQAPSMDHAAYDRLAVAYGLSRVDIASIIDAEPLPRLTPAENTRLDSFVSKDMC